MHTVPVRLHLLAGTLLLGLMWISAWAEAGPLRHHTFFPLWLGYILVVDGALRAISGSSLMTRLTWRFTWLYVVSVPIWWIFEVVNIRLSNWQYVLPREYSWLEYHLEASLAFSTVVPAIFVTAELVRHTLIRNTASWLRLSPSRRGLITLSFGGLLMTGLTQLWPETFFPLIWIGLFLLIDPLVHLLGGQSITGQVRVGRWDTVLVLFVATLICGFLWEFWNSRSVPKWQYDIAYADWLHVFEMPVLGFGGYLPFGLEVFALVCLFDRLTGLGLLKAARFNAPIESH